MRSVPADTLENFFATYQESGASPALGFTPIIDNEVVFANYTERALAGDQAKIVSHHLRPFSRTHISLTAAEAGHHWHEHTRWRSLRSIFAYRPH